MATGHNLEEELSNLHKRNPNFDVRFLLPLLVAQRIISEHDRGIIENCNTLTDAANVLFIKIMPVKDKQKQEEFFSLLQQQGLLDLPATKEFELFLFHLARNFPHYDIRNILPQLVAQLIISMYEKESIKNSSSPTDAAIILFLNFMPHKGQQLQQRFVNVLRQNDLTTLADHLALMIDQFYAQPKDNLSVPKSVNQPQSADRKVQQTVSTTDNIEYQNLIDAIGSQNPINIKPICQPMDFGPYISYYDFHGKRWALLINNYKYDYHRSMNRIGSLIDYDNMNTLLRGLGYEVVGKQDRTAIEMLDDVTEFAANMAKESDIHSCVVVVMTHGDRGSFLGVDNTELEQRRFFKVITKNEALVGKPKIFIIESDRGSEINFGAMPQEGVIPIIAKQEADSASRKSTAENDGVLQTTAKERGDAASMVKTAKGSDSVHQTIAQEETDSATKIATDADTCILYSTAPGYISWRNKTKGAWFIQTICQEFAANAHQPWADLLTLSLRVTGALAEKDYTTPMRNSQGGYDFCNVFQLPTMEVNMRKKFHFFLGNSQAKAPEDARTE